MEFKAHITTVLSLSLGTILAEEIIKMLKGKTFDVVTSHTGHESGQSTLEGFSLKSIEPEVSDTLIKIRLNPRRSLSFDVAKEHCVIIFETPRQIQIRRRLKDGHCIIRTILVKEC